MKISMTALTATSAAIAIAIGLAGFATPSFADRGGEPNSHSDGNSGNGGTAGGGASSSAGVGGGGAIGEIFSSAPPGTVGPGISGEIYGNTSNPSGMGNGVLPSLSPGPWVCGDSADCSAEPTAPGGSMGDFLAPIASDNHASSEFANGKDPGPDFSDAD
jgi:hypothetical protein